METVKDFINGCYKKGYQSFNELTLEEKKQVIVLLIREQEDLWKSSLLTDADEATELPNIIADLFETPPRTDSFLKLYEKLFEVLSRYFSRDFNDQLDAEINRHEAVNIYQELVDSDNQQRVRDLRSH